MNSGKGLTWFAAMLAGALFAGMCPVQQSVNSASVNAVSLPEGYKRMSQPAGSFGAYLRSCSFKQKNNIVYLFDGTPKANQHAQFAVLEVDVGKRDLQQCADAVMRLRAEYLYGRGWYDSIHFNFTSGHRADFVKYAEGFRPVINRHQVKWVKSAGKDYSYRNFRNYLDLVFTYAGTASLSKELLPVFSSDSIRPGDVFIEGGHPGHAVIVMDVAEHEKNKSRIFIIAQSYMPAQEIHVLKNPSDTGLNPWYQAGKGSALKTPEWTFEWGHLKRFR